MGRIRLLSWRITSLIWDPGLALTTGFSIPLEESLVWYSTDELITPLLHICVHTLLLCSPLNLLSFQHPSPHGYFTCASKCRPEFFILYIRFLVRYVVLNFLHFQSYFWLPALCPIVHILQWNLQLYNHQAINQEACHWSLWMWHLFSLFFCLCMCKCSLVQVTIIYHFENIFAS